MQPALEGYASAILSALDAPAREAVAADLESLHAAFSTNSALRAAFGDTSITGPVRAEVMRDLLADRLSPTAVRLAAYVVGHATPQETAAALEELVHHAHRLAHEQTEFPTNVSLRQARQRVGGFADGLLEDLPTEDFDQIEDDLFRWARIIESNSDLRRLLVDRDAPVARRTDVVERLLGPKVGAPTLRLALFVVVAGRARDIVGTLDYLVDHVAAARRWRVARVWSAHPLSDEESSSLDQSLRRVSGGPVDLQVVVTPALIGGVLIQIGDLRLDATTKGRLDALHEALEHDRTTYSPLARGSSR